MKATCKTCNREIDVENWAPMTEGYICRGCQSGYEAGRFRDLVKKRIEKTEHGPDCHCMQCSGLRAHVNETHKRETKKEIEKDEGIHDNATSV